LTRRGNIEPGHYHAFTPAQFDAIRRVCVWLYLNNPDVFSIDRVVGHDEVSPGRKADPGGALYDGAVYTMTEFRRLLWADVDAVRAAVAKGSQLPLLPQQPPLKTAGPPRKRIRKVVSTSKQNS